MLPVCYLNNSFSACKTTKSKGFSQSRNMEPDAKTAKHKRAEKTRTLVVLHLTHEPALFQTNQMNQSRRLSECHFSYHQYPRHYRVAAALPSRLLFTAALSPLRQKREGAGEKD